MKARFLVSAFLISAPMAGAQLAKPTTTQSSLRTAPVGFTVNAASAGRAAMVMQRVALSDGSVPRWIKWGLIGAAGGGVLFAIAGQSSVDNQRHSVAGDFAFGAGTGFVLVGGGVLFYDWVCSRGSRSRAAGLCGR